MILVLLLVTAAVAAATLLALRGPRSWRARVRRGAARLTWRFRRTRAAWRAWLTNRPIDAQLSVFPDSIEPGARGPAPLARTTRLVTVEARVMPAADAGGALAVHHRPVVLVHGILGFDRLKILGRRIDYFRGVATHLGAMGVPTYTVRMPPLDAVPERARALAAFIEALPHDRVDIVAHSMGGLDARYAVSRLGLHSRVGALVTVGTPHRGTPIADLAARSSVDVVRRVIGKIGLGTGALDWLTTERMERFNAEVPDIAGVLYACVPCGRRLRAGGIHPVLQPAHVYLRRAAGPSDGLVPVSSQLWGIVLDELDADHWAQIGWSRAFDARTFYGDLVSRLRWLDAAARHAHPVGSLPGHASALPAPAPRRLGTSLTTPRRASTA
jgi:triacylglycerol lipase